MVHLLSTKMKSYILTIFLLTCMAHGFHLSTSKSFSKLKILECNMKLQVLSSKRVKQVFPSRVTNEQWMSYWGINKKERLQRILESVLLSYGGAWMAWFLSFMAGGFVAGIVGSLLVFNWMYTPWLNAAKRNYILKSRGFYYGLFEAEIKSLKRIKRRAGKTIGAVAQEFLKLVTVDESGRSLEIVTEWQDEYSLLKKGMPLKTIIVSLTPDFSELAIVTDSWIPSQDIWIGDYPYVIKSEFQQLVTRRTPSTMGSTRSRNDSRIRRNNNNIDRMEEDREVNRDRIRSNRGPSLTPREKTVTGSTSTSSSSSSSPYSNNIQLKNRTNDRMLYNDRSRMRTANDTIPNEDVDKYTDENTDYIDDTMNESYIDDDEDDVDNSAEEDDVIYTNTNNNNNMASNRNMNNDKNSYSTSIRRSNMKSMKDTNNNMNYDNDDDDMGDDDDDDVEDNNEDRSKDNTYYI